MRQRCRFIAIPVIIAMAIAAQETVDIAKLSADADAALRAWREGDPKLEGEVGLTARGLLDQRIQRAGEDAQKATIARLAVANAAFQIAKDTLDWLDTEAGNLAADLRISAMKAQDAQLADVAALLDRNIQVFAADKDPGFQKAKVAMEKERTALRAVRESLTDEQKLLASIKEVGATRGAAVARYAELMSGIRQQRESLERESALWLSYYQALPQAARAQTSKTTIAPGNPREESGRVPIVPPSAAKQPSLQPGPAAIAADASRWVGEWTYPLANAMYYGDEPEIADLIVREQGGQLTGVLQARFKIPKGAQREAVLRFDFHGPLTAARGQKMSAVTPDGTKGTFELIPGAAANLIEVAWQLDASGVVKGLSKVRQGGMVLLKK